MLLKILRCTEQTPQQSYLASNVNSAQVEKPESGSKVENQALERKLAFYIVEMYCCCFLCHPLILLLVTASDLVAGSPLRAHVILEELVTPPHLQG